MIDRIAVYAGDEEIDSLPVDPRVAYAVERVATDQGLSSGLPVMLAPFFSGPAEALVRLYPNEQDALAQQEARAKKEAIDASVAEAVAMPVSASVKPGKIEPLLSPVVPMKEK
jgi:hypothetical protein